MVGDSLDRDLCPAKLVGMRTAWLRDDLETVEPGPGVVDATIATLAELPALLARWRMDGGRA
jgi:FMN phosphatase YigB (HAD superfamily)